MAATIEAAATTHRQGSARAVAVVGTAHFASHFYMLLLLPRFPLLRDVYGVGLHRASQIGGLFCLSLRDAALSKPRRFDRFVRS